MSTVIEPRSAAPGASGTVDESRPLPCRGAIREFWGSTVGKKAVMAVTGFVWVGYVVAHMLGNMKIYMGEEKLNAYAVWLREMGAPLLAHEQGLWLARIVLIVALVLHVWAAAALTKRSWSARPVRYAVHEPIQSTYASRTMRWGGVIILLFIIYHVLHLTFGAVGYGPGQYKPLSVYRNVVVGFSLWYVSAFYIAAMIALGFHLYHGVWSMFQTIGWSGFGVDRLWRRLAAVIALAVALGNISVPIAVLTGLVK